MSRYVIFVSFLPSDLWREGQGEVLINLDLSSFPSDLYIYFFEGMGGELKG